MSRDAIKVKVLPLVLLVIAPDIVMSLSAETVCSVVVPLRLLALTVSADEVLSTAALLVSDTVAMLLPVLFAVTLAPFTKLTTLLAAEIAPLRFIAPIPPNDEALATVMAPLSVAAVWLELTRTPLLPMPAPLRFNALATLKPFRSRV